jgi:beta-glucosidase/6-phospho-beta-glucosidase/beta-galactosidase
MNAEIPVSFASYFMGGFECSTQRRNDGRRLDLVATTGHDRHTLADYLALQGHGIRTVRDGLRWHLIEREDGSYDWSSFVPALRAAQSSGTQVIWDLCHYGWPDHIDIWSEAFVERFARFAAAAAALVAAGSATNFYCPINEISFFAWAAGDKRYFKPATSNRGPELKRQLCRAALAAIRAIRDVDSRARFITAEPLIHLAARSGSAEDRQAAETYRLSQYEAVDMLMGMAEPELGGAQDMVEIVGVNFYPENQWYFGGQKVPFGHHEYRPLRLMLQEVHDRYRRPILISETGAEGSCRAAWLHYVCDEAKYAMATGVPVVGICIYPILEYPGWDNDRPCAAGLLSAPRQNGVREADAEFADELHRQQSLFASRAPRQASCHELRLAGGRA